MNKPLKVNYEILDDIDNDIRFSRVKIWVAHTGWNLNDSYFSKEVLEDMAKTVHYIPIVGFIDEDEDGNKDFAGHEEELVIDFNEDGNLDIDFHYLGKAIGVIPENTYNFETKEVDGVEREYLTVHGLIWEKFDESSKLLNSKKGQSMELHPDIFEGEFAEKDGREGFVVSDATLDALCVLGDNHIPAMVGGSVEKFSLESLTRKFAKVAMNYEAITKYLAKDEWGTGDRIDIDLSEESASDDTWGDVDKVDLRNDILKASNYETLVEECYMEIEDGWEDTPSEHLKYPVCQIKSETLVYNINGVQTASAYMAREDTDVPQSAIDKLKDIREKLGLERDFAIEGGENVKDKEKNLNNEVDEKEVDQKVEDEVEETDFELTAMDKAQRFSEFLDGVEGDFWYVDHDSEAMYFYAWEENKHYGLLYSFDEEGMLNANFDEKYEIVFQPVRVENATDENFTMNINLNTDKLEEVKTELENYETKISDLEEKVENLNSDIENYEEKINTYESDIEELKDKKTKLEKFKYEKIKEDKIEYVKSVENLDEAEKDELVEEIDNYSFSELKDKVVKIIGQKSIKYTKKSEKVMFDTILENEGEDDLTDLERIMREYTKKKKDEEEK